MPTMVLWASLALLLLWQAILTVMILKNRDEPVPSEHRLGQVAAAMSDVVEQFDRVAKRRLADLDDRRGAPKPKVASRRVRRTCDSCGGHGWLESVEADPAGEVQEEPVRGPEVAWEPPRPAFVPTRVGGRSGTVGGR